MDRVKYIGLDVHEGLRGELHVTFEEGTWAAWLYDLLKPHVTTNQLAPGLIVRTNIRLRCRIQTR